MSREQYFKENYKLTLRLAISVQQLLLFAPALTALLVVAAFAVGAYALFVSGNYLAAVLWFLLTALLFWVVRWLAGSSQALLSQAKDLMEAASALDLELRDEEAEELEGELKRLAPLSWRGQRRQGQL